MPRKPVYKTYKERTAARTETHKRSLQNNDIASIRVYMKAAKKERLKQYSDAAGYSSVNECVNAIIDKALDNYK